MAITIILISKDKIKLSSNNRVLSYGDNSSFQLANISDIEKLVARILMSFLEGNDIYLKNCVLRNNLEFFKYLFYTFVRFKLSFPNHSMIPSSVINKGYLSRPTM